MLINENLNVIVREKEEDRHSSILEGKDRNRVFPPVMADIASLEKIASSEIPSDEGAWWIMYQSSMSAFNLAAKRDPVNNSILDEFWSELSSVDDNVGLLDYLNSASNNQINRPLPYDDVMEIIDYAGEQLNKIIR